MPASKHARVFREAGVPVFKGSGLFWEIAVLSVGVVGTVLYFTGPVRAGRPGQRGSEAPCRSSGGVVTEVSKAGHAMHAHCYPNPRLLVAT